MADSRTQLFRTDQILSAFSRGDVAASNHLFEIYVPMFRRWARGRIPQRAREYINTEDMVHDTFVKALNSNDKLRARTAGEFFSYLRTIFVNQIKQELRRNKPLQEHISQLDNETRMSHETDLGTFIDYDQALSQLSDKEQQAIIMRLEFGLSHQEVAELMNKNSADAARVFISRSLVKMAGLMS